MTLGPINHPGSWCREGPAGVRDADGVGGAERDHEEGDPVRQDGREEGGEDADPPQLQGSTDSKKYHQ